MLLLQRIYHQRGETSMAQGILPFQYEVEEKAGGMTALAGLPLYVEFAHLVGLPRLIADHVRARQGDQAATDDQMIMALVLLNLAGGDCVDDLRVIEGDEGFCRVLRDFAVYAGRDQSDGRSRDGGASKGLGRFRLPLRCVITWSFSTTESRKTREESMRRLSPSHPSFWLLWYDSTGRLRLRCSADHLRRRQPWIWMQRWWRHSKRRRCHLQEIQSISASQRLSGGTGAYALQ